MDPSSLSSGQGANLIKRERENNYSSAGGEIDSRKVQFAEQG